MFIYPEFLKDLLQIISLCILENNTTQKINNAIGRELYNFARHVLDLPFRRNKIKRKSKSKTACKKYTKCWICKQEKKEYMKQSLTPGNKICGACYSKIYKAKKRSAKFMHVVDLISNAIKDYSDVEIPVNTELGICCLTGIECQTVKRKDLFSSNFTNTDLLKAPDSDRAGISAYIALKYRPQRSSWFVNEKEFIKFDKNLFREIFLNGVKVSKCWAVYITTSYKKHGALVAKVNSYKYGFWRFEQLNVDARDGKKNRLWYRIISTALIDDKIGRSIIESLNCPSWLIKKIGLSKWLKFYNWAKDKYQSPLYKLCCYLLPSQKDLSDEATKNI